MFGLPIAFANPWILLGLISLPVIWWLLRLTPPRPQEETFPPTRILARLNKKEETPAQSPWWLTLLRLLLAAIVILAMAGLVLNPKEEILAGEGPVMIVMDDGWSSAKNWQSHLDTAMSIITEAEKAGRTVILESTSGKPNWSGLPVTAAEAKALLQASQPAPLRPSHQGARTRIGKNVEGVTPGQVIWLSDGLEHNGSQELASTMADKSNNLNIYTPDTTHLSIFGLVQNEPAKLIGTIVRANSENSSQIEVLAYDVDNVTLARKRISFEAGETEIQFSFDQPVELRNQFTRLQIEGADNAGAVKLLDENNRRRLVGLISGESFDQSSPLLSPLYYISRALEPFSDIRRSADANLATAIPDLVNQQVSVIVMADVGTIPERAEEVLSKWIDEGGMLIRFSGPRLGTSSDKTLLPVEIRPGDRSLGGALSWETPKPLAPFDRESPFSGIEPPRDVLIKKQLLALQETGLDKKTWSRLEDGTPLVTADKKGAGWIVLYHVGTNSDWSNLPLSGTFVEMLRRTVNLANSGLSGSTAASGEEVILPPLSVLDGHGKFMLPNEETRPLKLSGQSIPTVSKENPPGFYGTEDGVRALNLFSRNTVLKPLDVSTLDAGFEHRNYLVGEEIEFKSWLLVVAGLLLIADCIAILWMSGAINTRSITSKRVENTALLLLTLLSSSFLFSTAEAQESDYSAALKTRLAYVVTGVDEVDRISEAGMRGLTQFITTRTALEPGEPVGLDISVDELSFFSLIYWPVDPRAPLPDEKTMARIDAFMKQGGSVLFDTRDQISGAFGGTSASPAAQALQLMLTNMDIPPLEPVPEDHVLTKAFYLLERFPGRFNGGDLWVEVTQDNSADDGRPARVGDGVSSILITSNDFAGAWAVDNLWRPLYPTVPPDPLQRNHAFRSGVNLIMYALTGNYKSDQVHLPALLERLGQ